MVPVPFINLGLFETELLRETFDGVLVPVYVIFERAEKNLLLVLVLSESPALDFDSGVVFWNGLGMLDLLLSEEHVNLHVEVDFVWLAEHGIQVDFAREFLFVGGG